MRRTSLLAIGLLASALAPSALPQAGDADYGREMLNARQCSTCHKIDGQGAGSGPDLAVPGSKTLSPNALAAKMWNHAPAMFEGMKKAGVLLPYLSEYDIANYYAWLYSIRYFDPAGDANAGKIVFNEQGCSGCHELKVSGSATVPGPPVESWSTMADPVLWAQSMWNHGAAMEAAGADQEHWPSLDLQQMVDLVAFIETQPAHADQLPYMRLGDWVSGQRDFTNLSCAECHTLGQDEQGKINLLETARRQPLLSGLAVEMWNHRPAMAATAAEKGVELPVFDADQMADITSYLFREGYFQVSGDAARGKATFESKACASCHDTGEGGAPKLGGWQGEYSAIRFASAVWMHGPNMSAQMNYLGKQWPELSEQDVADLVAMINAH